MAAVYEPWSCRGDPSSKQCRSGKVLTQRRPRSPSTIPVERRLHRPRGPGTIGFSSPARRNFRVFSRSVFGQPRTRYPSWTTRRFGTTSPPRGPGLRRFPQKPPPNIWGGLCRYPPEVEPSFDYFKSTFHHNGSSRTDKRSTGPPDCDFVSSGEGPSL